MNKIAPAFVAAKKAFGPALKDRSNPAFKSKYADLGACIDAVEDALLANGIACYHESTEDAAGITVECVLLHESGETIRGGKLHVPAVKHDPQGFGSAMTYARRYSLMAVCGIAPEDDDGNAAAKSREAASQALDKAERAQWIDAQAMKLEACESANELKSVWADAYGTMKGQKDAEAIAILEPVKDRMKAMIAEATA